MTKNVQITTAPEMYPSMLMEKMRVIRKQNMLFQPTHVRDLEITFFLCIDFIYFFLEPLVLHYEKRNTHGLITSMQKKAHG